MHRAFHAIDAPLTAPDGRPTNALFGFFAMFNNVVAQLKPHGVIVAFDHGKPDFRYEVLEQYKLHRKPTDERLKEQFPIVRELLEVMKIPVIRIEHWEGDDLLGSLARRASELGIHSYLATSDKDAYQLLSDMTSAVTTKSGQKSELVITTPRDVEARYGIRTDQVVDYLGLKGDPSDNIPGVMGIGEKTAAKLLQEYETMDAVIDAAKAGEIKGAIAKKIVDGEAEALASRQVATIVCDVKIDLDIEAVEFGDFDQDEVSEAFGELRVKSPLTKLLTLQKSYGRSADPGADGSDTGESISKSVDGSDTGEPVSKSASQSADTGRSKAQATEKSKRPTPELVDTDELLKGIDFNIELAAYLLNSTQTHYDLETLAHEYLGLEVPDQTSLLEPDLDVEQVRADLTGELATRLYQEGMWDLYTEIELPLIAILKQMEETGIKLDTALLDELAREGRREIDELTHQIYELAGREFTIDSPKQLATVLFEDLGLPPLKKKKTGYSTDASVLEKLVGAHPIIERIMSYRELVKLQSTYLEALPRLVDEHDKLHTHFNQTVTATGRLSSSNPNLQNIPVRTELGRRVREAFIPCKKDWKLLSSDYSQIELRVLAELSGDEGLIEAFNSGEDFHTATAMRIFDLDKKDLTSQCRARAKAVNFGIVYGQSAHGLAQTLSISNAEAQEMIDRYYNAYPRVKEYLGELIEQAQTQGWVETAFGRRRNIPEITSPIYNVREFGKRTAMNHPMQGTAADLVKLAMIAVDQRLREQNLESRMLLQVHDELIFEGPESEMEELGKLVTDAMVHVARFKIPLEVTISIGDNWAAV